MTTTAAALPFPVTPRRPGEPEPDLFGFSVIHRALRSGTRLIADATAAVSAGEPCPRERHEAIVFFTTEVLAEVHAHHSKEDDVLWPVIATSAGPHIDLTPLSDDHVALQGVLTAADSALATFTDDCRLGAPRLAAIMTELADELDEHIADEEATVFPVMRTYVSKADFAKCERLFQKGASFRHLKFLLPWIASNCTASELSETLHEAPAPMRLMLRLTRKNWNRRRDLVAGRGI